MSDKGKIRRRQRCPECGSLQVIKWGVRNSVQRYKCIDCLALFSSRRKDISRSNRFPWFRKWVSGKMTVGEIADASGYSPRQLHRWFDEYLDQVPTWTISTMRPVYLLIDGTFYSDGHCLIIYRAENLKRTLFYRFTTMEDDDEIASDLLNIKAMGYNIAGITTDGSDNIIRAAEYAFPDVPRQRCMVHVQRECLRSITMHPRSPAARLLRGLVMRLGDVETANDMRWWMNMFCRWEEDNREYACEKGLLPNSGQAYFIRNDLRKAYIHLRRAIPNLFVFIDHPGIPKTTNAVEAFFGHLKDHLRLHRGLSGARVDSFIKWYLFFNDAKKKKG